MTRKKKRKRKGVLDGGGLVDDVSGGGVVVEEKLVDGGSVFVGSVEGSVVEGVVASDGLEDVELGSEKID